MIITITIIKYTRVKKKDIASEISIYLFHQKCLEMSIYPIHELSMETHTILSMYIYSKH